MWQGVCFCRCMPWKLSGALAWRLSFYKNGNRHTQYGSAKQNTGRFTGSLRISGKQGQKSFFRYQTGLYAASFCIVPGISALGTTQPAPYPKRAAVKITGSGKTDFFSVKQDNRSVHAETASSPQIRTLTVCKDNRSVTVLPGNRSIPERISAPRHTVPVNRTRNLAASCIPTGIPARPAMIFPACHPVKGMH